MKFFQYFILLILMFGISYSQKVEIIPIDFNSSYDDFNSNITKNGRVIFFTSGRDGSQKVYISSRDGNSWSNPYKAKGKINDGDQNGAVSLTSDGQYMLFAATSHEVKGYGRTDIYSAEKVDGKWTNIKNLGPNINSEYWDSQPMISNDGNILFFVSDRPGGYGGTDIYMSVKKDGEWAKAVNAGKMINSEDDEMAPVIGIDDINFTFSSDRPGGYGGLDIYVSKFKANSFSKPINAGSPINSSGDDLYYYSMPNSDEAYFSSSRDGGSGKLDIYKAVPNPYNSESVYLLSGVVKDIISKDFLGANIVITDLKTKKKVADLRSDDETGEYFVVLQQDRIYSITAEKDGYLFYSERYEVPKVAKGTELQKDIELSPIRDGNTRLLIFFDFDKATLKDESYPELDRAVRFLTKHSHINISIEGHTDDVGTADYNKKLSENRAKTVKDYLVKNGISANRIKTVGHGFSIPIKKEKTEEARSLNRRVEMKIIK